MSIDTIFKSSMRKMKNSKSEGEMKRIISEFDRECDKYVRQLHSYQDELFARLREWRWANEKKGVRSSHESQQGRKERHSTKRSKLYLDQ